MDGFFSFFNYVWEVFGYGILVFVLSFLERDSFVKMGGYFMGVFCIINWGFYLIIIYVII